MSRYRSLATVGWITRWGLFEIPSCAKTRPIRHRRKNCASRNQAQTLARERVTRQAPTFDCGSTRVPFFAAVRY